MDIEAVAPSADEVRTQLDRLLSSGGFANAERMSGFLRYVVERALAGESDQVKEYVVGVAVFDRDEQYDPRLDSIVRVEARRLRTKLDEYYAGPGLADPIVIRMPRGSYTATFERGSTGVSVPPVPPGVGQAPASLLRQPRRAVLVLGILAAIPLALAVWGTSLWTPVGRATPMVTIAVLPFAEFSNAPDDALLAARLTDGVTTELARRRTVGVVSSTSAQQFAGTRRPLKDIAQALDADMILEGSVFKEGTSVRVEARLVDAARDRKVWVDDVLGTVTDLRDLERRVAAAAAAAAEKARSR